MSDERITFNPNAKVDRDHRHDSIEAFFQIVAWYKKHKKMCSDLECIWCGMWECPHTEPTHRWHDGCAACVNDEVMK